VSLLDATRERVAAWRQVGNPLQLYLALGTYASACARGGDLGAAERAFGEADALEDPGFPPRVLAEIASDRVSLGNYRNDGAAYRAGLRLSMQLSQKAGADAAVAGARRSLADAALMAGEVEEAVTLGRAAVADPRVRDRPRSLAVALSNLNAALLMAGNLSEARITALEAVPLAWQTGIAHYCFDHVALYAVLTGAHAIAAQLLGFADHMYATGEELRQPNEARSAGQAGAALDAALGAAEHARLRAAGAACTPAQADALAHAALEAGS
jgi:hypothetical protein